MQLGSQNLPVLAAIFVLSAALLTLARLFTPIPVLLSDRYLQLQLLTASQLYAPAGLLTAYRLD